MRISTICSLPVMVALVLLAFLIRFPEGAVFERDGSGGVVAVTSWWRLSSINWRSNGLLLVAAILLLRFIIETLRLGIELHRTRRYPDNTYNRHVAMSKHESKLSIDLRMTTTAAAAVVSLLILGGGFITAGQRDYIVAYLTLAACVATIGAVSAGAVLVLGKSLMDKAFGFAFLIVNGVPIALALWQIGSALRIPWR